MKIVKFDKTIHMDILVEWLVERNSYVPRRKEMPKIGFVVYDDKTPVSIGCLRKIEGGFAFIDGLCTNPKCAPELRNIANDLIATKLMVTAKEMGLRAIVGYTMDPNTLERAKRHGYKVLADTLFVLSLE